MAECVRVLSTRWTAGRNLGQVSSVAASMSIKTFYAVATISWCCRFTMPWDCGWCGSIVLCATRRILHKAWNSSDTNAEAPSVTITWGALNRPQRCKRPLQADTAVWSEHAYNIANRVKQHTMNRMQVMPQRLTGRPVRKPAWNTANGSKELVV